MLLTQVMPDLVVTTVKGDLLESTVAASASTALSSRSLCGLVGGMVMLIGTLWRLPLCQGRGLLIVSVPVLPLGRLGCSLGAGAPASEHP